MVRRFSSFVLVVLGLALAGRARAEDFFFKDGDRIVIIGDSITEQLLYSNYVEMWTVARFPAWKLTFRNVGIGGDVSPGGNRRFARDVLSLKPTAMTVDFGMNDGGYRGFEPGRFKNYMDGLQGMADKAKEAGIRVAWITPSPVEKKGPQSRLARYNETLEKYSAGVQEIAAKNHGLFVDQFHPFVAIEDKARAADPKNLVGGGDEVHPGPPGQAVMAWAILKGLHFPTLVSSVEIDAAAGKVTASKQCAATDLVANKSLVRFQQQDEALPFFPAEAKSILRWAPIEDELNEYRLKVTGLEPGKYKVRLGDKTVAEYTAEQLTAGVNLAGPALKEGPVADQVAAVWKAVQAKDRYFHDRIFRGVVLAGIPDFLEAQLGPKVIADARQATVDERSKKLPAMDEAIRLALAPRKHAVEIAPAESK